MCVWGLLSTFIHLVSVITSYTASQHGPPSHAHQLRYTVKFFALVRSIRWLRSVAGGFIFFSVVIFLSACFNPGNRWRPCEIFTLDWQPLFNFFKNGTGCSLLQKWQFFSSFVFFSRSCPVLPIHWIFGVSRSFQAELIFSPKFSKCTDQHCTKYSEIFKSLQQCWSVNSDITTRDDDAKFLISRETNLFYAPGGLTSTELNAFDAYGRTPLIETTH
jgi:hypothetical protein